MQIWSLTDPGCVRTQNQDAFEIQKLKNGAMLCVVCDGMGGAKAGNVASAMAAQEFAQEVKTHYRASMGMEAVDVLLDQAVKNANFAVYDKAQSSDEFAGMGTTLVAVLIRGKQVTIVNVGDSRAYSITEKGVYQLTTDHSLVQMMIDKGELTPDKANTYPGKNLITRAIGTEMVVESDIFHHRAEEDECLLLCTDGLSNLVDDQELLFEVVHGEQMESTCQRLLAIAKNRGAPDNVTCVLAQI